VAGAVNGVAVYGHWGRPVLAFPAEGGDAREFERQGMVAAIGDLLEAGRVKLYCVDSFDRETWSNRAIPLEERARRHGVYEAWLLGEVVPFVRADCGGVSELIAFGPSLGAFHAANPRSGARTSSRLRSASRATTTRPPGTAGGSAATPRTSTTRWTTWRTSAAITSSGCGDGSACCSCADRVSGGHHRRARLDATFRGAARGQGIRRELDVWGHDVAHDWPWWRAQLAHHLPRFC